MVVAGPTPAARRILAGMENTKCYLQRQQKYKRHQASDKFIQ